MIPPLYQFLLLSLIAYRAWHLLAEDEILETPRRHLVRLPNDWNEGSPIPLAYREKLASFINCPWCLGAWTSLLAYIGWMATVGQWPNSVSDFFIAIGIWFAISCVVGLIRSKLDPPE